MTNKPDLAALFGATSADTSFSTQSLTINLTDVDEFDVGAISDTDGSADQVAENAANGKAQPVKDDCCSNE